MKTDKKNDERKILEELKKHAKVQEMKQYIQHGDVSTFEHCEKVAELSSKINQRFHINADEETLMRGAMLHDFYLYDWHHKDNGTHDLHGFFHAEKASENAEKILHEDKHVCDVIRTHMWPLNITKVPGSREAWIVCAADKIVSIEETLRGRSSRKGHGRKKEK